MKLIYIHNGRMPTEKANGYQVAKMCEAFTNLGFEVELVVPWRFNEIKDDLFNFYQMERRFRIKRLPCLDFIPLNGILGNWSNWLTSAGFLLAAKVYLSFQKYDLLYTRERFVGLLFNDFVLEVHSLPKQIKSYRKRVWHRARTLVVLTSFIKDRIIEAGIDERKILVAPDAVDLNDFVDLPNTSEIRRKLGLSNDKKLIGYVGMLKTIGMEKGVDVAIKSLNFLDDDFLLVIVGGHESDIDYYQKFSNELGIKNIIFVGQVKRDQVSQYMKSFDVLLAPFPKNDHYSFCMSPLKIFEYMAAGKPIIASDLPALREILNEQTAVLVEPGSPEQLAKGIGRVLNNKQLAQMISQRAQEKVRDYTWDKRAENIIKMCM